MSITQIHIASMDQTAMVSHIFHVCDFPCEENLNYHFHCVGNRQESHCVEDDAAIQHRRLGGLLKNKEPLCEMSNEVRMKTLNNRQLF